MIDGFIVLCAVFWDKVHAFYAVSTNISGAVDLFVSGVFRDLLGTLVRLRMIGVCHGACWFFVFAAFVLKFCKRGAKMRGIGLHDTGIVL